MFSTSDFNSEQLVVFNGIMDAFEKNENATLLLSGPGGCGKTHVAKNVIKNFLEKNEKNKIIILAPTHKAKRVIVDSFRMTSSYKKRVYFLTVASFLGYKETTNENGKIEREYNFNGGFSANAIIVDECSMISREQFDLLKTVNCNILYMGDECQLNPIGEKISPVFSYNFHKKFELTINERIKNGDLVETIMDYRNNVIQKRMTKKSLTSSLKISNKIEFDSKIIESFNDGLSTSCVLCWTNQACENYNKFIRSNLFNVEEEKIDKFYEGENVVFNKFCYFSGKRFYTSDVVKLLSVKCDYFYIKCPTCICEHIYKNKSTIDYLFDEYTSDEDADDDGKRPKIKKFSDLPLISEEKLDQRVEACKKCHTPPSISIYKKIKLWRLELEKNIYAYTYFSKEDKASIFNTLYKYKDRAKLVKNKDLWSEYYNFHDILVCPVNYIYSMTIHKSQGSTFDNVFVDMQNVMICRNEDEKTKMSYTAMSRAKHNLHFYY